MATKIGLPELQKFLQKCDGCFERVLNKVKIVSAANGSCTAEMKIEPEHTNLLGGLHGGFSSTLVDCVTSWALLTHDNGAAPSVSVDLHLTFLKGAVVNDEIIIDAKTLRAGKSLGFLTAEIKNKITGDTLVRAAHTKYILRS